MSNANKKLTEIFKNQNRRICSLEFSAKKSIDFDMIDSLTFSFCSVIWIGNYEKQPDEIEPLMVAGELIKRGHPCILHFSARNNNKKSVVKNLEYAKQLGVRNLLVIRGASPECQLEEAKYDFPFSTDLIKYIKRKFGDYFDLCVPGYPYKHPESKTLADDMKHLKAKNDAGAKFIITQAAFSYEIYKDFLKNCRKHEITMQIIPGVYVIRSVVDFCLLKKLCKVPTEDPVVQFIKEHKGKDDEIAAFGVKISNEIIKKILSDPDFCPPHIYTMNEFDSIKEFINGLKY